MVGEWGTFLLCMASLAMRSSRWPAQKRAIRAFYEATDLLVSFAVFQHLDIHRPVLCVAAVEAEIPPELWAEAKAGGLIAANYPYLG